MGGVGGRSPPTKTPRQRSARSALYLRAQRVASYSKARGFASRKLTRNAVESFYDERLLRTASRALFNKRLRISRYARTA